MADRAVQKTRKDQDGDILALCDGGASWSPHIKEGRNRGHRDQGPHVSRAVGIRQNRDTRCERPNW